MKNNLSVQGIIPSSSSTGGDIEHKTMMYNKFYEHIQDIYNQEHWNNPLVNNMEAKQRGKRNFINVEEPHNEFILDPNEYETNQDLFNAVKHWWIFKQRNKEATIKGYLRIAKRMATHNIFPINWKNLRSEQVINYLEHREYQEHAGICAVLNEWKTCKVMAKAFGIDADKWGYRPPHKPKPKTNIIPLPKEVKHLTGYKYTTDKYQNALIQYILYHGFLLGLRPSEMVILKTTDLYLNQGYIIIREPKKYNQERQIFPEKELLTSPRRKSFSNWLKWRSQILPTDNNDFLYLQKNGNPFTVNYLRKTINHYVKPLWPEFNLYKMRHFCATARLISSKVETGRWDIWDIKETLGHDKLETTQNYIQSAKKYYRISPHNWIKALLKFHKEQYKGLNPKVYKITSLSNGTNRSSKVRICRNINLFSPVKKFEKIVIKGFSTFLTKLIASDITSIFSFGYWRVAC